MKIVSNICGIMFLIFIAPFLWLEHQKTKRKICKYRDYEIETYQCFKTGRWHFWIKGSINDTIEYPKSRRKAIKIAKEYIDNMGV